MLLMHAKPFPALLRPSWRALHILSLTSLLLCIIVVYITTWGNSDVNWVYSPVTIPAISGWGHGSKPIIGDVSGAGDGAPADDMTDGHPIEQLMKKAQERFNAVLKKEATSLEDAAQKYRVKRGRHPPPGFDAWYAYATEKGALVIETFFDPIYHDLDPFWGIGAHTLREIVHAFNTKITIRDGHVDAEKKNSYETLKQTMQMLQILAKHPHVKLPDMDIPFNVNDGPAMLVPWEDVDTALSSARHILASPEEVSNEFAPVHEQKSANWSFDPEWLDNRPRKPGKSWLGPRPLWSLVQPACPPDSPAAIEPLLVDVWDAEGKTSEEHSALALLPLERPAGTFLGFAKKWKFVSDVCRFPNLQGLHGTFVAPRSMSVTQKLFPIFSSTKLSASSEILVPSVSDWDAEDYASSQVPSWSKRESKLFWRGPATGGKNTRKNWQRLHRHRFVAMLNATHVEIAEVLLHQGNETSIGAGLARNFRLLPANDYLLETQTYARTAPWVNSWADAAFTDLRCGEPADNGTCAYTIKYFPLSSSGSQAEIQKYKYAAAIDDDSGDDQGVFLQSLRSGKFTLRASIFRQWYDQRVMPWLHYVPMDNTFVDLYGIMEYFVGTETKEGADQFRHTSVEVPKHEHHFLSPHEHELKGGQAASSHAPSPKRVTSRATDKSSGHDRQAQKIAEAGQQWANKVLRKEDMMVYLYRLLLEYARIVDGRRQRLGWVDDLIVDE